MCQGCVAGCVAAHLDMQQLQVMHVSSAAFLRLEEPASPVRQAFVMNSPRQEATPPRASEHLPPDEGSQRDSPVTLSQLGSVYDRLEKEGEAEWARMRQRVGSSTDPALGAKDRFASTCAKAFARSYWGSRGMPGVFAHLLCRPPRGVLCSLGLQGVRPADGGAGVGPS